MLRERREELGWSLADVAERTGLSRAYVHALERGRTKRPSAATVRSMESAFGSLSPSVAPTDAPPGLAALAAEHGLSPEDVAALAALRIRGRRPESKERWSFIYQALLVSESIDDRPAAYQRSASGVKTPKRISGGRPA